MMERLGERGDINISEGGCNADLGHNGLEVMPNCDSYKEYLDVTGRHKIDVQINIDKFGKELHNGILNTKEMAHKWNWKSDSDELNWRNTPCALRIGYKDGVHTFKVHVWNDLLQIWINLALTKEDVLKILEVEKEQGNEFQTPSIQPYCDSIRSHELRNGIMWEYIKDDKVFDTAFMSYKELYEIQIGKKSKCQFCDSIEVKIIRPRTEDTAIYLCKQHIKYIQRLSQKIHGKVDEI